MILAEFSNFFTLRHDVTYKIHAEEQNNWFTKKKPQNNLLLL